MPTLFLARRSLAHHWRAHLAVALGVIVATATITGALLVGDALRGSLKAATLERLGSVDVAVQSAQYVRADLADELEPRLPDSASIAPVTIERTSITHADTRAIVHRASILGVDEHFWQLDSSRPAPSMTGPIRPVVLNRSLANELGARVGDDVLLHLRRPRTISPEMLLGRRDDPTVSLRLTVADVVSDAGLGSFALTPRQTTPLNAFVPLQLLQRSLKRADQINTLLIALPPNIAADRVATELDDLVMPKDAGLRLRTDAHHRYVALESDTFLLSPTAETAGRTAARELNQQPTALLSYLANRIWIAGRPDREIPYSTVVALDATPHMLAGLTLTDGTTPAALQPGQLWLNQWAADDLGAVVGDRVRLRYYITDRPGQLAEQEAEFELVGVLRLAGSAADPGLTPAYPGLTDTTHISGWDPPFPIDLDRVRDRDETYWDDHRATPKAFISLADGLRLWAADSERFGHLTALRLDAANADTNINELRNAWRSTIKQYLSAADCGLRIDPVRTRALRASRGTTDFAALFVGFSLFVIIAAALLITLLFRLNIELRSHEIGLLLAVGFTRRRIATLLLSEGLLLSLLGALLGLPTARGYAHLMLVGLRTCWSAAVNAPFLRLHDTPTSYLVGLATGLIVALLSITLALRGLTSQPPRALLADHLQTTRSNKPPGRLTLAIVLLGGLVAIAAVLSAIMAGAVGRSLAFFISGAALLVALLALTARWLACASHPHSTPAGSAALLRISARNARRHAGRSLLTISLMATASFSITALQAMRLTPPEQIQQHTSGTGGFTLLAESTTPLLHDLNTPTGRAALNLSDPQAAWGDTHIIPARLHAGDETSCLNLYAPTQPRILGISNELIYRGGFSFAATLADDNATRANPWRLLDRELPGGAIPTIADEAAALWQLHRRLGDDLIINDERGHEVRLRLVALLRGSVLQGELTISENNYTHLYPTDVGYRFFLIETPTGRAATLAKKLEHDLTAFGLAADSTIDRIHQLQVVQNTYLSTFQTLGGLGLLLGTCGLAVVLLRNVWERRPELALLRTMGFTRRRLSVLVLAENALLVAVGLTVGVISAAVVTIPQIVWRGVPVPWTDLLAMFTLIFAAGLAAGALALCPALRAPLLPALRSE